MLEVWNKSTGSKFKPTKGNYKVSTWDINPNMLHVQRNNPGTKVTWR
jgi:hypothetical protein